MFELFLEGISGPLFELAGATLLGALIWALKIIIPWLKDNHLGFLSNIAVRAVEQSFKDSKGQEKKDKAIDKFVAAAKKVHLKVTEDQIEDFIESAVEKMNAELKKTQG